MPEIPLYKQQTRVSAETPQGMMLDLSSESAALARTANVEIQGMENLTKGVAQAITNYETLVDEAAMADFGNEVRDFKLNLAQGGIKFRDKKQDKPYDFQTEYIEPEIEKFKERLYRYAMKSSLRKWALGLDGWKYWVWQLGVGLVFFTIIEIILNKIGMTMLPWK